MSSKHKNALFIFEKELITQIEHINSPDSLLNFLLLLNIIASDYKGGEQAVAPMCKTLLDVLRIETIDLLKNVAQLKKDIVELKEKKVQRKPRLDPLAQTDEMLTHEMAKKLSQCFKLIKKSDDQSAHVRPSKSDYEAVLELLNSVSVKLENK